LLEPTLIIVDEPWDISAKFMLPLQARARLRLRVTVSLTVAPSKVIEVWWGHTVAMPYTIAVIELPRRRNIIFVYVVDDRYRWGIRLVVVRVLINDSLKHFLRCVRLAIRGFYRIHEIL
jgi:hypothetical protein